MKILQTIYEFHNKEFDTICGLYHVELDSGGKYYFLRNDKSVGVIQHFVNKSASECVVTIRDDVKKELFELFEVKK